MFWTIIGKFGCLWLSSGTLPSCTHHKTSRLEVINVHLFSCVQARFLFCFFLLVFSLVILYTYAYISNLRLCFFFLFLSYLILKCIIFSITLHFKFSISFYSTDSNWSWRGYIYVYVNKKIDKFVLYSKICYKLKIMMYTIFAFLVFVRFFLFFGFLATTEL